MLSSVWDLVNLGHLFKCAFSGGFGYTRLKVWSSGLQIHIRVQVTVCVYVSVCVLGRERCHPERMCRVRGKLVQKIPMSMGGRGRNSGGTGECLMLLGMEGG